MEFKKQKPDEESNITGEDHISKLPESLLHRILSLLQFKHAVQTSVLAKRWTFVWASLSTIEIEEWRRPSNARNMDEETQVFMKFMESLFNARDKLNMKKFSVWCDEFCDQNNVNFWLDAVVKCKVEEVSLCCRDDVSDSFKITRAFFTCDTLTRLEIEMPIYLDLPSRDAYLPKLKVLRLICAKFKNEDSIRKLVSHCPVLEELEIKDCSVRVIDIASDVLKNLFIDANDCREMYIKTPSLEVFHLEGTVAFAYDLKLPMLVEASITLFESNPEDDWASEEKRLAAELLSELKNVKRLIADSYFLGAVARADELDKLPLFHNLVYLEVVWDDPIFPIGKALMRLYHISPNLETIVFSHGLNASQCGKGLTLTPTVPECFLSHLKVVEFREFGGDPREFKALKLFSQNATVLQRIIISTSSALSTDLKEREKVGKQLQRLGRASASPACIVDFS